MSTLGEARARVKAYLDCRASSLHKRQDVISSFEASGVRVDALLASDLRALVDDTPDLLDALKDVLRVMEEHEQLSGSASTYGDNARAAIAKATGRAA